MKPKRPAAPATEALSTRPFEALRAKGAPASRKAKRDPKAPPPIVPPRASRPEPSFETHMRGVQRLPREKPVRVPATDNAADIGRERRRTVGKSQEEIEHEQAAEELAALVEDGARFEVLDDGSSVEGRRIDVDPREIGRLRRGRYPVDGKLDLHGHDAGGAKLALERFLERRRAQGDRAVLVVHGKGVHSPRGAPVLRGEVGAWLSQGHAARHVLAFVSREDADGGSGAVFVLLARRRG